MPGTSLVVVSPSEVTVTSPAARAGTVDVTVSSSSGTSAVNSSDSFTFEAVPAVTPLPPWPACPPAAAR